MHIIRFIERNGFRLFFLLLLSISLWLTLNYHLYNRSDFVNSSNGVFGYFYINLSSINDYFKLKKENRQLFEENVRLKEFIVGQIEKEDSIYVASSVYQDKEMSIIGSKIIKNSYQKQKNILTIKGGTKQGIDKNMGVIDDNGIVGIIENVSNNYATVLSVLNTNFRTVARVKKNDHFGTLIWNGKSTKFIQLIDIPRIASVEKGDTIVTGVSSMAFPQDIPIGQIEKIYFDSDTNSFTLDVRLFNDMTTLNYVYVIRNNHRKELEELEKQEDEW